MPTGIGARICGPPQARTSYAVGSPDTWTTVRRCESLTESPLSVAMMSSWLDLLTLLPGQGRASLSVGECVSWYERARDERILELYGDGIRSLAQVASRGEGIPPRDLATRGRALGLDLESGHAESGLPLVQPSPGHQLDYEWYFAPASRERLLKFIAKSDGENVLLLGCPSIASGLAELRRRVVLVDKSEHGALIFGVGHGGSDMSTWLRADVSQSGLDEVLRGYLAGNVSSARVDPSEDDPDRLADPFVVEAAEPYFDVVVMDPPWYPDYFVQWLAVALRCVRAGGRIISAFPPRLTRPTARLESRMFTGALKLAGSTQIRKSFLRYSTPLFEAEMLEAVGMDPYVAWRAADLLEIIVDEPSVGEAFSAAYQAWNVEYGSHQAAWSEVSVAGQYVKYVQSEPDLRGSTIGRVLRPIDGAEGFSIPSVSRRAVERSGARIWTSRNRVASGGDMQEVVGLLEEMNGWGKAEAERYLDGDDAVRSSLRELLFGPA